MSSTSIDLHRELEIADRPRETDETLFDLGEAERLNTNSKVP